MLELTTFNKRKNRWVINRPATTEERDRTVMIAYYLGWKLQEIADDWGVSNGRIVQIKKHGERHQKELAALIIEANSGKGSKTTV